MARALTHVPLPGVAYITVSQCDFGFDLSFVQNVVDLSAGGHDNDPVPLLIGAKSAAKTHIADTNTKRMCADVSWVSYNGCG